jgi:hypothetical protein
VSWGTSAASVVRSSTRTAACIPSRHPVSANRPRAAARRAG